LPRTAVPEYNQTITCRGYTVVASRRGAASDLHRLEFTLPGCAEQDLASLNGSYPPVAKTADERSNGDDPRPSLQERDRARVHDVPAVAVAAQRLVEQRLSPEKDADRYVALAMQEEGWG
jgi:hypothetical protein